jgi:hypothetical protein
MAPAIHCRAAIADGEPAPNAAMNSNLDAKLVSSIQSEIDVRRVSFPGKSSQKFNQIVKAFCALSPRWEM